MARRHLALRLFGPLRVNAGGREIDITSATARSILAYLALSPRHKEDRGRLAAMIWEASDEPHARQNLRQALLGLGRIFGKTQPGVMADRATVGLAAHGVWTDLHDLLETVSNGVVPDDLIGGRCLPHQLLVNEPARGEMFESWLRFQRRDYENRLRDGLTRILGSDDKAAARRAAQALLAVDRSDEQAVRFLMRDYDATGQTARALSVYEDLWNHLDADYDAEPGAETQALIAEIKSADVTPMMAPPKPAGDKLRIGLVPVTAADDGKMAGIARLFRAELMAALLRFRAFEIVDQALSTEPVDYVLDLTVGADGHDMLFLAGLTRRADGVAIWSESLTGVAEKWLTTQASVVSRLTSALSLHVSRARLQDLGGPDFGAGACDDWLMGNRYLDEFRADASEQAAKYFRKVIEKAPNASMGYSSLSRLNNGLHLMQPGVFRTQATHQESKAMAGKAVALDPLDSRAHLHRAWACCLLGQHDQSAAGFTMARKCNPNDPWTLLSSGLGAAFSGDDQLAQSLSKRVIDEGWTTAPFQWGFHAPIRFLAGDYAGCVEAAEHAQTAIINIPGWQACALWHLGESTAARAAWDQFETLCRDSWTGPTPPDSKAIGDWFLSLFPVRSPHQQNLLAQGVAGVAGLQVH